MNQELVSFVLRFVREVGEDQQARWRGIIQHVQGDASSNFTRFSEAVTFMQEHVNEMIRSTFDQSEKMDDANPFLETAKMWGEFMPRYTQMMMDSMNEAMSGQAAASVMPEQMQQMMAASMAAWGMPSHNEQQEAAIRLETLTEQLTTLTEKIAILEARLAENKKEN